jgi:hypothetical protein
MKGLHVELIEETNKETFLERCNAFMEPRDVFSVKLQRNLYYAGVGSSAGRTPGVTTSCPPKEELQSSFVAFVVYKP